MKVFILQAVDEIKRNVTVMMSKNDYQQVSIAIVFKKVDRCHASFTCYLKSHRSVYYVLWQCWRVCVGEGLQLRLFYSGFLHTPPVWSVSGGVNLRVKREINR